MIHSYQGKTPKLHPTVFTVDSAEIIGDVVIDKDSSIWYNAVIRGDVNYIRIGERTNIQDGCILHVRQITYPLIIGSNITVGHGAILHACTVEDKCLIGMGAVVLDNARIGSYTIVGAGAVVRNNTQVPEGVLIAGVPAKIIRDLTKDERDSIEESAQNYVDYIKLYRQ
jgi:carbonic anhydrase/acetyltransferase-like protein (isoleucine patch superfamily)